MEKVWKLKGTRHKTKQNQIRAYKLKIHNYSLKYKNQTGIPILT